MIFTNKVHNYISEKDEKYFNELKFIIKETQNCWMKGFCRTCQILERVLEKS